MPSLAFSSYDAIMWIYNRVEGVTNPLEILEKMREMKLICHASGDIKMPIVPGFYMYYIVKQDPNSSDYKPPMGDLEAFSFEWMEVEVPMKYIIPPAQIKALSSPAVEKSLQVASENDVPSFLKDEVERREYDKKLYKNSHLEVDLSAKSDRIEWGHCRYQYHFVPGNAFELVVQWVTASGPIVYDLVRIKIFK
jgi:hypothetical protein